MSKDVYEAAESSLESFESTEKDLSVLSENIQKIDDSIGNLVKY